MPDLVSSEFTENVFRLSLRATRSKLAGKQFQAVRDCFVARSLLAMTIQAVFRELPDRHVRLRGIQGKIT